MPRITINMHSPLRSQATGHSSPLAAQASMLSATAAASYNTSDLALVRDGGSKLFTSPTKAMKVSAAMYGQSAGSAWTDMPTSVAHSHSQAHHSEGAHHSEEAGNGSEPSPTPAPRSTAVPAPFRASAGGAHTSSNATGASDTINLLSTPAHGLVTGQYADQSRKHPQTPLSMMPTPAAAAAGTPTLSGPQASRPGSVNQSLDQWLNKRHEGLRSSIGQSLQGQYNRSILDNAPVPGMNPAQTSSVAGLGGQSGGLPYSSSSGSGYASGSAYLGSRDQALPAGARSSYSFTPTVSTATSTSQHQPSIPGHPSQYQGQLGSDPNLPAATSMQPPTLTRFPQLRTSFTPLYNPLKPTSAPAQQPLHPLPEHLNTSNTVQQASHQMHVTATPSASLTGAPTPAAAPYPAHQHQQAAAPNNGAMVQQASVLQQHATPAGASSYQAPARYSAGGYSSVAITPAVEQQVQALQQLLPPGYMLVACHSLLPDLPTDPLALQQEVVNLRFQVRQPALQYSYSCGT